MNRRKKCFAGVNFRAPWRFKGAADLLYFSLKICADWKAGNNHTVLWDMVRDVCSGKINWCWLQALWWFEKEQPIYDNKSDYLVPFGETICFISSLGNGCGLVCVGYVPGDRLGDFKKLSSFPGFSFCFVFVDQDVSYSCCFGTMPTFLVPCSRTRIPGLYTLGNYVIQRNTVL